MCVGEFFRLPNRTINLEQKKTDKRGEEMKLHRRVVYFVLFEKANYF